MVERVEQVSLGDPQLTQARINIARQLESQIGGMARQPLPAYQTAGLSPAFIQAAQAAGQGVGAYAPFLESAGTGLEQAAGALGTGVGTLQQGLGALQRFPQAFETMPIAAEQAAAAAGMGTGAAGAGIAGLTGTGAAYDPSMAAGFFDPFQEQVIAAQQQEMQRMADIQRQGIAAQAVGAGAFGGSREAVQQAELTRNLMDQQARLGAELRSQGFQQAQQQAQTAFEAAQQRQQQAAQLTGALGLQAGQLGLSQADLMRQLGLSTGQLAGQEADISRALGLGIGSLGTEMGQLSMSQAQLGALGSSLLGQDVQRLAAIGEMEREQQQRVLDAQRATGMQDYLRPFQELGALADIYSGIPTSQSIIGMSAAQQPSLAQQVLGTGISALTGLAGAQQSGLF